MLPAPGAALDLDAAAGFLLEGMRIGEIAALVGVTTRAIRRYHQVGLLPEPERRPNRYRAYSVRDAVLLARVRRLTELGAELYAALGPVAADPAVLALYERLDELWCWSSTW